MTGRPLDPGLAAILASIRETVGGAATGAPTPPEAADADSAARTADAPAVPPAPAPATTLTLEAFVRRIAEPHIKAWLDANLPEIVQREVAKAVDRLVNPE